MLSALPRTPCSALPFYCGRVGMTRHRRGNSGTSDPHTSGRMAIKYAADWSRMTLTRASNTAPKKVMLDGGAAPLCLCRTPMWMHPHTIKLMKTNSNTPEAKQPASAGCHPTTCSASSRRFVCKMCGDKCRSSNQDRGKRDMCRTCEQQ